MHKPIGGFHKLNLNQKLVYFLVITSILYSSSLINQNEHTLANDSVISKNLELNYIAHGPIRIMNDIELASVASSGTGYSYDPYIIEELEILTTGQHCIHINGTTKYFIIQDCHLRNDLNNEGIYINDVLKNTTFIKNNLCEYTDTGIFIDGVENATIINNICTDNNFGIKLWNSANSTVTGNTCSDNDDSGIWPNGSSNSAIINNTIIGNLGISNIKIHSSPNITLINNKLLNDGVLVFSSEYCSFINNTIKNARDSAFIISSDSGSSDYSVFINNTIEDSKYGITINSQYITLFNNEIIRSSVMGVRFWAGGTYAIITNNTFIEDGINFGDGDIPLMLSLEIWNNTVNNLPLGFFKSQSDQIVQSKYGQIVLVDCDNITLKNQNCSYTSKGIAVYDSINCRINDSICNNNVEIGIDIISSPSTIISSCFCTNTISLDQIPARGYGIRLLSSGTSILYNNTCQNNDGGGIYVSQSSYTDVLNCYCSENHEFGIRIELSIFCNVINNTCEDNIGDNPGIHIWNTCDQTTVKNNTCINEYIGIRVDNVCEDVIIENNTLKQIGNIGIEIMTSIGNEIIDNSIISSFYGIVIQGESYASCDNTKIFNNTIMIDNDENIDIKMGIKLIYSPDSHIEDNIVEGSGIYIHETYDDYYTATIKDNLVNGKPLAFYINTNDLIISIANEFGQIILVNCENIVIYNQELSNLYAGIFVYQSTSIKVIRVKMENNYYGFEGHDFDDSRIFKSRFAYNYYGLNLVDSTNNIFYLNTFLSNNIADFTGLNYDTTLYNSSTQEGNYWSIIPTADPYGRGVVPELSFLLNDITCNEEDINSLYPTIHWNVSDDNLASYEIYIDDILVSSDNLVYRYEMIVWNLPDYITDVGIYEVKIKITDHDNFSTTNSLLVTITTVEPTTTSTTTTSTPISSTTSNTDTTSASTSEEGDTTDTETTPEITPSYTLVQGLIVLISITLFVRKKRK